MTILYKLRNYHALIPLLIFIIALKFILLVAVTEGHLPGDLGDSRLNLYILEHYYLAFKGSVTSFTNASFFYPWQNTILFSDTNWGSGIFYVLFRFFSATKYQAFAGWFFIGFVLNFWITYFVNRSLGLKRLGATIAAFIFTFSPPVLAQFGHAQLLYRFYVPLAFWSFHRFLTSKDIFFIALTFFFLALQLLTTFYIGVFLFYFLSAYLLMWKATVPKNKILTSNFSMKFHWAYLCLILTATFIIFLLVAIPYIQTKQLYDLVRFWGHINVMLPRISSYFINDKLAYWIPISWNMQSIPYRQEHQLFVGVGSSIALLSVIFTSTFWRSYRLVHQFLLTLCILITCTLLISDFSLYRLIINLPGVNAIRAVSRIILVFVFPIGFIVGQYLDDLNDKKMRFFNLTPISLILSLIIIIDSINITNPFIFSETSTWDKRIITLTKKIKEPVNKDSVLIVAATRSSIIINLDAMLYAQEKGIKTLNGYSGNFPPGFMNLATCERVAEYLNQYHIFAQTKSLKEKQIDPREFIYVDFDKPCLQALP